MELRPFAIDVVVIQRGAIVSEWNGMAREGLMKYSGNGARARAYVKFMEIADWGRPSSPEGVVAKTIVKAVHTRKPKRRYATGVGAKELTNIHTMLRHVSCKS